MKKRNTNLFVICTAVGSGIFSIVMIFSPAPARSQAADYKRDSGVVKDTLSEMPWFDAAKDDYKKYSPEELKIPRTPEPRPHGSVRMPAVPMGWVGYAALVFLIMLLGALLLLLMRNRLKQKPASRLSTEYFEATNSLAEENPERRKTSLDELLERVRQSLQKKDWRNASILIFYYLLIHGSLARGLALRENQTARSYLKQAGDLRWENNAMEIFQKAAMQFEKSLYGGESPSAEDILELADYIEKLQAS